ncbi:bifunctional protein-serine/threonine kinase/phosphatase [Vibrio natriegens]|uniref:Serine/threonine protein kinase n=1 Tax=Vibrio natriegens NBRC 15636 = ATCC 14048 = DSM 759 TaxID=1219067 RepID=A0AAN0Y7F6_VIBNA|nr:bifunctional protein-serine/threonine kinase/phosphatase [Vibrio natriegens]ALR18069.1 serine/threonine protein kinase [Vibrio natriegens NBRC 15636 = ATCC 14048 = DSM 759]ANQ15568.1 serine/threonine protein kinase [Vibrio natriegens NBRC 15636 = ATCC 14048 = DSM 759]EPM41540.1 serine/threonine protein kinase [Vibrio natriegens NBRC 15636 = ATCC 14048 = DSM 759]MDX6029064.1 bifunctional protein-serine/threonine kinase/phosphatase [Vibrio natriegens NBRC 15636 = ATCC 14048 = DSM 759]UUI14227
MLVQEKSAQEIQHIEFSGCSLMGKRDENQDAFIVKYPTTRDELIHKGVVACIADGVSCSNQAQQASQTATTQFVTDYYATPSSWSIKRSAIELLTSLNSWLYSQGKDQLYHNGMVTTFSAIVIKSNTGYIFHVGDSRVYLYRDDTLTLLTRDHQRTNFGHQSYLTRALGMDEKVEIDFLTLALKENDTIVLTTDGVHETLTHEEIKQQISSADSSEALSQALCNNALFKGSTDNVSCTVLNVKELPSFNLTEYQTALLANNIPPALHQGQSLDHFEILDTLYEGPRSHVYLAFDRQKGGNVIIKAPSLNYSDDPETLKRFANEQWFSTQLDSRRVMKMYPRPVHSKFIYQVCEYIEGITLRQWMHDHPNPPLDSVREILDGIVKAVRVFQRADMVHRDLKPENIMITPNREVKIIDFGTVEAKGLREIQQEEATSFPLGSVNYTAPEYINTGEASTLSDLFSIGIIGYEMLTAHLPYKEHSQQTLQQARHVRWDYHSIKEYREDIPLWVDLAFKKATAEIPTNRYQALGDFIADLFTPNTQLLNGVDNKPLLKRNPILFWKSLALLACTAAVLEGLLLLRFTPN